MTTLRMTDLCEQRRAMRDRPLGPALAKVRRELVENRNAEAEERRRQTRRMLRSLERRL